MENFSFCTPTKYVFGKNTETEVAGLVKEFGSRVLLVHDGREFMYDSGLYKTVTDSLKSEDIYFTEITGIKPNPRLDLVYEGIELYKKEKLDFILAVGGGSVIDTAKAIGMGINYDGDVWDLFSKGLEITEHINLGVILTLPATGSESSNGSVISNKKSGEKLAAIDENLRPKFAIMNPELTYTLPPYQTACGCADIISHVLERYFANEKHSVLVERYSEATVKTVMESAVNVQLNPKDYNSRAEIMWAGSWAHNDFIGTGRLIDAASHIIGHELSAKFDIAHGATLSVIFPAWMKYVHKHDLDRFRKFAVRMMGLDDSFFMPEETAMAGIRAFEDYLVKQKLPVRLSDFGMEITGSDIEFMAEQCTRGGTVGNFVKLDKKDVIEIFSLAK